MKIAIHNHHLQPWFEYHPYIKELIKQKEVSGVYISDRNPKNFLKLVKNKRLAPFFSEAKTNNLEIIFDIKRLNAEYDVLIDVNFFCNDFVSSLPNILKKFDGVKLFHIGDYFGYHSSEKMHSYLRKLNVTALLGYCMHDRHCKFFREYFPYYSGKVWGVPFGYSERFKKYIDFKNRKDMAISLGSLNHLSNKNFKNNMFFEALSFFSDEAWFHRFREKLFSNRSQISEFVHCGIPDPFSENNQRLDLVEAFNNYKFFVTCESIFNFPTAKVFEGTAAGSILLASNHSVYDELGFKDQQNCILFEHENLNDLIYRIRSHLAHDEAGLEEIAKKSHEFTLRNFNSLKISQFIIYICKQLLKDSNSNPLPYSDYII